MDESTKRITRGKAIRLKCLDCMCGQANEVKLCPCTDCPLYPFRLGKDPYRKPMSEEQKNASRERMIALKSQKSM